MNHSYDNITGRVGMAFWKRSDSGRSRSLWVCVREVDCYKCSHTGLTYRRWLVRELIRGGVGPMHGKALRKCWTISWVKPWLLAESEYTGEIKALIDEAIGFEQGIKHVPSGMNWYERANHSKQRYDTELRSVYKMFGLQYKVFSRKSNKFEVATSSGNGLKLFADFADELKARDFIKELFARKYAQHATLTDKFDGSVQKFRRKKY